MLIIVVLLVFLIFIYTKSLISSYAASFYFLLLQRNQIKTNIRISKREYKILFLNRYIVVMTLLPIIFIFFHSLTFILLLHHDLLVCCCFLSLIKKLEQKINGYCKEPLGRSFSIRRITKKYSSIL